MPAALPGTDSLAQQPMGREGRWSSFEYKGTTALSLRAAAALPSWPFGTAAAGSMELRCSTVAVRQWGSLPEGILVCRLKVLSGVARMAYGQTLFLACHCRS